MCNNQNNGWIKLFRNFTKWEWYSDSESVHLFLHLLLKANHKDRKWRGITIKRGQLVTSYGNLSNTLNISVQKIRTRLLNMQESGELTYQSTSKYSIITICNYDSYQGLENENNTANNNQITNKQQTDNNQITNKQQTDNNQITTNKNEKKNKKIKNDKNIKENTIKESRSKTKILKPDEVDLSLIPKEYHSAINEWLLYKEEMKEGYRPRGWKAFTTTIKNKYGDNGEGAEKLSNDILFSISQGYKGIYEDRSYSHRKKQTLDFKKTNMTSFSEENTNYEDARNGW